MVQGWYSVVDRYFYKILRKLSKYISVLPTNSSLERPRIKAIATTRSVASGSHFNKGSKNEYLNSRGISLTHCVEWLYSKQIYNKLLRIGRSSGFKRLKHTYEFYRSGKNLRKYSSY